MQARKQWRLLHALKEQRDLLILLTLVLARTFHSSWETVHNVWDPSFLWLLPKFHFLMHLSGFLHIVVIFDCCCQPLLKLSPALQSLHQWKSRKDNFSALTKLTSNFWAIIDRHSTKINLNQKVSSSQAQHSKTTNCSHFLSHTRSM